MRIFAHLRYITVLKEEFISGIYNYCDRWCERCTFTSRCETFNKSNLCPTETDIKNNAFWEQISSSLDDAIKLLQHAAKEHGVDLTISMSEEEQLADQQQKLGLKTHPLSILCKQYQKIARSFAENSEGFTNKTKELEADFRLGISAEKETLDKIALISDSFEIIKWYLYFIGAKLQRAIQTSLMTGEQEDEDYQNESNGSAKIALIAIQKSMGAWSVIYRLMPLSEDVALNALALLEQLSKRTMKEVPGATKFIRPGFDE